MPWFFSAPGKIYLALGTAVVVTVRSSLKPLLGCCFTPDLQSGPLHSASAPFTNMFIANANRFTDMVQPVIMPTSSWCQTDVSWPDETLMLNFWFGAYADGVGLGASVPNHSAAMFIMRVAIVSGQWSSAHLGWHFQDLIHILIKLLLLCSLWRLGPLNP